MHLPTPDLLKEQLPLTSAQALFLESARAQARAIVQRTDTRVVAVVGPCSVHEPDTFIEYARRLAALQQELKDKIFLVVRLFVEKPRTLFGWRGLLYDPFLDQTHRLDEGLRLSRSLFLEMANLQLPAATEFLDPLTARYFEELVCWGFVGARTAASQPHRQMASGLSFPIGFKNDLYGRFDAPLDALQSSATTHAHLTISPSGQIACQRTQGNPFTHLVLRGGTEGPNYDPTSIQQAVSALKARHLPPRLLVDCSHGNCAKNPFRQRDALLTTIQTGTPLLGWMVESYLLHGNQPLSDPAQLTSGLSITDPCLGWEDTEALLREAYAKL